uniref:Uncharacterized protein n=1 Tax=Mycena chlorophos TaxID=658473 RepID=A0ABQ0LEQ0_MYCCL|nr:predicted protein [Mycena chlorophos]
MAVDKKRPGDPDSNHTLPWSIYRACERDANSCDDWEAAVPVIGQACPPPPSPRHPDRSYGALLHRLATQEPCVPVRRRQPPPHRDSGRRNKKLASSLHVPQADASDNVSPPSRLSPANYPRLHSHSVLTTRVRVVPVPKFRARAISMLDRPPSWSPSTRHRASAGVDSDVAQPPEASGAAARPQRSDGMSLLRLREPYCDGVCVSLNSLLRGAKSSTTAGVVGVSPAEEGADLSVPRSHTLLTRAYAMAWACRESSSWARTMTDVGLGTTSLKTTYRTTLLTSSLNHP